MSVSTQTGLTLFSGPSVLARMSPFLQSSSSSSFFLFHSLCPSVIFDFLDVFLNGYLPFYAEE